MILLYCVHSSFVPCFPVELEDKVLDGRRRDPPGGAPVPRWTEPDVEDEDRGKRGGCRFCVGEILCCFFLERRLLNFVLVHCILFGIQR